MNNTTKVLPFNFQRYFYGQTNTPDSNYNTTSSPQKPYWGKPFNSTKKNTSLSSFEPSNETKKWGMLLAFFGKNKTLKTPSLPKTTTSTAVSSPVVSPTKKDLFSLPLLDGELIFETPTPVVQTPKKPTKPKPAKNNVTLPIFGGGDLSTPKPTGPFLTPSMNDLFQTITYKGTVATGQRSGYWGDPHVLDAESANNHFIVTGPGTYNLLKDKNIALSAEHKKYDNWAIEVTNQINLALGTSNVVFNAYGVPTLNGQALEQGKLMTLPDGSSVNWNGTTLSVKNANFGEYNLDVTRQQAGGGVNYLDTWINSTDKGVFSDGILPTGILGEGFDMDNLVRTKLNFDLETYKV
jgi:hypothetical protein